MIRRTALFALMITLVLLSACVGKESDEESFNKIREGLNQSEEISFKAQIKANYSEKTLDYTISSTINSEGAEMTVLKPELVAGVKAAISNDSLTLSYDGLALFPGSLPESEITPLAAPSLTLAALREGHVVSITRETLKENDTLAVVLLDELENSHTVWISADTGIPLFAELQSGGRVVLTCAFSDWTMS